MKGQPMKKTLLQKIRAVSFEAAVLYAGIGGAVACIAMSYGHTCPGV